MEDAPHLLQDGKILQLKANAGLWQCRAQTPGDWQLGPAEHEGWD